MKVLWIALAGGAGTVARYLLDGAVQKRLGSSFPWGILAVNMVGCFLIALVMQLGQASLSPDSRAVVTTGFLGGFTTYSAFNYETLRSLQEGRWSAAVAYVAATLFGCLLAGALGWLCAVRLRG